MTHQIAFYGKGGVGKSNLISNISAALVEAGFRVLQVGCDPKADSCRILNGGLPTPTLSECSHGSDSHPYDAIVSRGFKGTYCIELGAPPDSGTQGSAEAVRSIGLLGQLGVVSALAPDFVLYDVSSEHAVGSYHQALAAIGLSHAFVITTADYTSLAAVNSIMAALEQAAAGNDTIHFGGLILNDIASSFEESFIADFAKHTGTRALARIPRSLMVRQCELYGKTVIEASPLSNQSYFYRRLANLIADETEGVHSRQFPSPLSSDRLRLWAREWADRIFALENGLVTDGAAI